MANDIPYHFIDAATLTPADYDYASVMIIVYTHDGRLLLQQRDGGAPTYPHYLGTFGGAIEVDEEPLEAMRRELNEELGAVVNVADVTALGAVYGAMPTSTRGRELQYAFIWHDRTNSITGCYEGLPAYYATPQEALEHKLKMPAMQLVLEEMIAKAA